MLFQLSEKVGVIDRRIDELQSLKRDFLERIAQSCPLAAQGGLNAR